MRTGRLWNVFFFFCIQSIIIVPAYTSSKIHTAIIPPEYKTPISSNLKLLRLSDQILHNQYLKALTINLLKQFLTLRKRYETYFSIPGTFSIWLAIFIGIRLAYSMYFVCFLFLKDLLFLHQCIHNIITENTYKIK
jgi:hypothetical protein